MGWTATATGCWEIVYSGGGASLALCSEKDNRDTKLISQAMHIRLSRITHQCLSFLISVVPKPFLSWVRGYLLISKSCFA